MTNALKEGSPVSVGLQVRKLTNGYLAEVWTHDKEYTSETRAEYFSADLDSLGKLLQEVLHVEFARHVGAM